MKDKVLNPKWLYAAIVEDDEGRRWGTVSEVLPDGDTVIYYACGKPVRVSAKELDAKGQIVKKHASDSKYLEKPDPTNMQCLIQASVTDSDGNIIGRVHQVLTDGDTICFTYRDGGTGIDSASNLYNKGRLVWK